MSDVTVDKAQALLDGATPGPWKANGEPWNLIVWSSADNRICFMAHSSGLDEDRDVATAELVAAAPDLARAYIAQAAELTRLRAQVAAADKLAEDVREITGGLIASGLWLDLQISKDFYAALSAYVGGKE